MEALLHWFLSVWLTSQSIACGVVTLPVFFFLFFFVFLAWVHLSIALACRDKVHTLQICHFKRCFPFKPIGIQAHTFLWCFWVERAWSAFLPFEGEIKAVGLEKHVMYYVFFLFPLSHFFICEFVCVCAHCECYVGVGKCSSMFLSLHQM